MTIGSALGEFDRQNKELLCGESAITASVAITTQFETIYAVSVTGKDGSAPALKTVMYTYDVTNNIVTIFGWKPTSAIDTTLIAATDAGTVGYIIIGRRRQ